MNKTMKKVLLSGTVVLGLGFSFIGGNSLAGGGLANKIILKANEEIGKAGYDKKEQLVGNIQQSVENAVGEKIDGTVSVKKNEVENESQAHFNRKVDEFAESDSFKAIESEMEVIKNGAIERYTAEIDRAFKTLN